MQSCPQALIAHTLAALFDLAWQSALDSTMAESAPPGPPGLWALDFSAVPAHNDDYEPDTPTATTYLNRGVYATAASNFDDASSQSSSNTGSSTDLGAFFAHEVPFTPMTPYGSPVDSIAYPHSHPATVPHFDFSYLYAPTNYPVQQEQHPDLGVYSYGGGPMVCHFPLGHPLHGLADAYLQPWTTAPGFSFHAPTAYQPAASSLLDFSAFPAALPHPDQPASQPSSISSPASSVVTSASSSKRFSCSSGSSCSDSEHAAGEGSDEEEYRDASRSGGGGLKKARTSSSSSSASSKGKDAGTKRFACEYPGCDRAFARRFNLTTHVASTHHQRKPL
jgi:hypothetical protein